MRGPSASLQVVTKCVFLCVCVCWQFYRDHAAWCPYCQKIWLQVRVRGNLPYSTHHLARATRKTSNAVLRDCVDFESAFVRAGTTRLVMLRTIHLGGNV